MHSSTTYINGTYKNMLKVPSLKIVIICNCMATIMTMTTLLDTRRLV